MKKLIILISSVILLMASCTDVVEDLAALHLNLQDLKASAEALNVEVEALKEVVASIEINFITNVEEILDEDSIRVGYTLIYEDGRTLDLMFGKDGSNGRDGWNGWDGRDGEDGKSPKVGAGQDTDGKWYWTLDGEWMKDSQGNRIPISADGTTPKMKIMNGYWYYSFDNGINWKLLFQATANAESIFDSIDYKSNYEYVILKLKDGTELRLPKKIELEATLPDQSSYFITAGGKVNLEYNLVGGKGDAEIDVFCSEGLSYTLVTSTGNSGKVVVSADKNFKKGKAVIFLKKHGKTFMKSYDFFLQMEGLSKNGTANSYIITSYGTYRFYADAKGCSDERLDAEPVKAEVLWESFGTSSTPSAGSVIRNVKMNGQYIEFTTAPSFKEGNAVIAALDTEGNILWSWHIWAVKYYPADEYAVFQSHPGVHIMMMNLGALTQTKGDPRGLGLYYQWGRKDPFPGPARFDNWEDKIATTAIWPKPVKPSLEIAGEEYVTRNPMTIISRLNGSEIWDIYQESLWCANKTKNDPCPPGWQIPCHDYNWHEFNYSERDDNLKGKKIPSPYSVPETWFPSGGYYYVNQDYTHLYNFGYAPHLWCSHIDSQSNQYNYSAPNFAKLNNSGWSSNSKADLCTVRCVSQQ